MSAVKQTHVRTIASPPAAPWSPLQKRLCIGIALAKRDAFIDAACYMADLVKMRMLDRAEAAELLQVAADHNSLAYEYGADHIQAIMATAFTFGRVELADDDPWMTL